MQVTGGTVERVGKTKSNEECIFLILTKLKGPSQVFFAFYSTIDALGDDFIIPFF